MGLGDPIAVFVDQGVAIPGEIGGRFAGPGSRIKVRGKASRRLIGNQLMAIAGLPHRNIGSGKIQQYRRPGHRRIGGGRNRHPQILADLDMELEQRLCIGFEQEPIAEGNVGLAAQFDGVAQGMVGRSELAQARKIPGNWADRFSAPRPGCGRDGSRPRN